MLVKMQTGVYITERRGHPRKPLKLWTRYQCLQKYRDHSYEGIAEDIGAGGLAMRSDLQLNMGELLMLTLFLPPADKRVLPDTVFQYAKPEGLPAAILSRVAWCIPARETDYVLGVQFLDMDRENRRRLKSFLVEYRLDRPDSSLYV